MVGGVVRRLNGDLYDAVGTDSANDEIEQIADVAYASILRDRGEYLPIYYCRAYT